MVVRTLHLVADPVDREESRAAIAQAAAIVRAGGTVAFATETVYGLGANALDPAALRKVFAAKQRPAWDPLIVHVCDEPMLRLVVAEVPEPARLWMEHFWPGPLTLLLPRSAQVPDLVTAGRARVGVRMPRHPVAQALLRAAAVPIAAPSANLFGHVSPTTAAHVLADLDGRIDAVLDGGSSEHGLESTVVDACEDPCLVYRPGAVTLEQLRKLWPRVEHHVPLERSMSEPPAQPEALPSPGFGLRHYAPRAALLLVEHGPRQSEELVQLLASLGEQAPMGALLPQGLLTLAQEARLPDGLLRYDWGAWNKPEELAQRLFAGLRALDATGVTRIACPLPPDQGLGAALCDRLRKAARPL